MDLEKIKLVHDIPSGNLCSVRQDAKNGILGIHFYGMTL